MGDDYYLQPNLVPVKRVARQQTAKAPPKQVRREPEEEYYDPNDSEPVSKTEKSFSESVRENKILAIIFAVIIILLICFIVWMMTKGDKTSVGKQPTGPPTTPPAPSDTGNNNKPAQEPKKPADPPPEEPVKPKEEKKPDALTKKSKITDNEKIIQTVDDAEIMKYMNAGEPDEDDESEND